MTLAPDWFKKGKLEAEPMSGCGMYWNKNFSTSLYTNTINESTASQVVQQTGRANKSDCRRGTRAIDDSGIQISKQSTVVYKRISRNVTLDLTQNCSRVNVCKCP
ncbi:hypothetical protein BDEG_26513 [Batrachochytrium dendrobatidis JEL423]|uniref:Uncharacterized protein n=1 Tax=Batrachochytrium dendrobatidis (strain JEL423) TaxID=403673 RepID=A0A177WT95_BATDL|nr:hypothetical protein BDEG_26513 [Batrachochytrium dendrobatidis JEL423]